MFTRPFWVRLHRWAGLAMAGFLIVVGLTGSLLAFYPELERLAHPHWYPERDPATWVGAGLLAEKLERAEPRLRVVQVSLQGFDGATSAWVEPRIDPATGKPFQLGYGYVLLDPATGSVLDRIQWGSLRNGWTGLMSFVYALHYSLALDMPGVWILGICALIWTLDCFVGFYLTLPAGRSHTGQANGPERVHPASWWQRWKPAWMIKWRASPYRLNFDLHRASGLWLWGALLIFAWSSVYMNLWDTVYTWTTRALFDYRPYWTEFQSRPVPMERPELNWLDAQTVGERLIAVQVAQQDITVKRPVSLRLYREFGLYQYQVETDREIDDRPRRYTTQVFFDADSGALKLALLPARPICRQHHQQLALCPAHGQCVRLALSDLRLFPGSRRRDAFRDGCVPLGQKTPLTCHCPCAPPWVPRRVGREAALKMERDSHFVARVSIRR
jgi:uncharacterized iron-regulated membrane protein